jgi:SAM-dependent methyltransferase
LEKDFPDWNNLYNTQNVESMPWYNENLDSDLDEELERRKISKGRILDLGTGPATQAIQLAKRGLEVIGSDISEAAINKARELYVNNNNNSNKDMEISFIVDDILNSKIKDKMFDYVFDRGCFHVLPIDKRLVYIKENLRRQGNIIFKMFQYQRAKTRRTIQVFRKWDKAIVQK